MKHIVNPLGKVSMPSQWLDTSAEQVGVRFECLGRAMKKNSARQHEFAILLRLLSSRFDPRSTEHQALRLASQTTQNKSTKLRNLMADLGRQLSKPGRARPIFLIWFRPAQLAPSWLTIPLLRLVTEKPIRGRSLDAFYSSQAGRWQKAKRWTRSRAVRIPKE